MVRKVAHLRDDIRKTFTTYALIPVFIISLISLALAFTYWNKTVLERNNESRVLVCEALTTIITSYMDKASELAGNCDLPQLAVDERLKTKMYQQLYAQVNILHADADFYIIDAKRQLLLSNKPGLPEFLQIPADISWGLIGELKLQHDRSILRFIGEPKGINERQLAIGKTIVRAGQVQGYIIFVIPGSYILQAITNPHVEFVVSDRYDYTPIATNYRFSNDAVNKLKPEFRNAAGYFSYEHQKYYITQAAILDGELNIYAITPIGNMVSQYTMAVLILLGVLVILTVTIVISVKKETVAKTEVIDQLVEAFAAVQQGNLATRLNIKTNNEFEIIGDAYNTMLASLQNLLQLNNDKARETVISEIKQLESQFNPHFLFNTLENIKFMIKLDPAAASKMIVALSTLLRYSINNKIGEVTIDADMTYTQSYLDIQQVRFGDRLNYVFRVEPAAKDCIVPKLIFQPIIENAIKYGAQNCRKIRIEMEVWIEAQHLEIIVFNSGTGMDEQALAQIRAILAAKVNATRHMGLYNVHRRIQLLYGDAYGVDIMSAPNSGTTVRIVLPVRRSQKGSYKC